MNYMDIYRKLAKKQTAFDQWLNKFGIKLTKQWTREHDGIAGKAESVTLQTFIRNHIHHPENTIMRTNRYTSHELKLSIDEMYKVLHLAKVKN